MKKWLNRLFFPGMHRKLDKILYILENQPKMEEKAIVTDLKKINEKLLQELRRIKHA